MKRIPAFRGTLFMLFSLFYFVSFSFLPCLQTAPAAQTGKGVDGKAKSWTGVLRLRDRKMITFGQMIKEISGADIIIIGETHTSMTDHRAELAVIKSLHNSEAPLALGLEMFRSGSQKDLDGWVLGELPVKDFQKVYYSNWGLPWEFYSGILFYARQVRMPVFGLNLPPEISGKVFEHGFASLTPAEKKGLPPGVTCTVDEQYKRYIKAMYQFHAGMGGKSFYDFCQAQMLWDSTMAANITAGLAKTPGMKMVVLAGVGHAWKKGIPAQIKKTSRYRCVVVLPGISNGAEQEITPADADYLLLR